MADERPTLQPKDVQKELKSIRQSFRVILARLEGDRSILDEEDETKTTIDELRRDWLRNIEVSALTFRHNIEINDDRPSGVR